MRDNEFYQSPENWPQPPDERPTLEAQVPVSRGTPAEKTGTSRKRRKKLTDSLASLVVGAIAVIMVANSIGSVKDDKDYDIGLGGVEDAEVCEICGTSYCDYRIYSYAYGSYIEGLRLKSYSDTYYNPTTDPVRTMNGSVFYRQEAYSAGDVLSYALYTQDSLRLFLLLDQQKLPVSHYSSALMNDWYGSRGSHPAEETSAISIALTFDDMSGFTKGGEEFSSLYVQLLYDPNGNVPELGFGLASGDNYIYEYPFYHTEPIAGAPNTWIRAYSNIDQNICDSVMDYCSIKIVRGDNLAYELGTTMLFQEDDRVGRIWNDNQISLGGVVRNLMRYSREAKSEVPTAFDAAFNCGTHKIWSNTNEAEFAFFNYSSFPELAEQWMQLNENAPSKGHNVIFPLKQWDDYTANGITYHVYAAWYENAKEDYDTTLFLVPSQEPVMAIVLNLYDTGLDPQTISSVPQLMEISEWNAAYITPLLEQISLK